MENAPHCRRLKDYDVESLLPLSDTLHQGKKKKPKLVVVTPKKTKVAQVKNTQVSTALSTKDGKKVKSNISKNKKDGLLADSQTPQLKSRSGRTIKQRILD